MHFRSESDLLAAFVAYTPTLTTWFFPNWRAAYTTLWVCYLGQQGARFHTHRGLIDLIVEIPACHGCVVYVTSHGRMMKIMYRTRVMIDFFSGTSQLDLSRKKKTSSHQFLSLPLNGVCIRVVIDKPHGLLSEVVLDHVWTCFFVPKHGLGIRCPLWPLREGFQTVVVRIKCAHESNVRGHDVPAVLTKGSRQSAEAVECRIRGMERTKNWKLSQAAEQRNLAKHRNALFDLVGPALALALGVSLLEEVSAAGVEDVVADGGSEALVLGTELVQVACVEWRALAGISGVRVGERTDFLFGGVLKEDFFPVLLEVGVCGEVELWNE